MMIKNKFKDLNHFSEAMITKRIPSINNRLKTIVFIFEEILNNYKFKYELFLNNNRAKILGNDILEINKKLIIKSKFSKNINVKTRNAIKNFKNSIENKENFYIEFETNKNNNIDNKKRIFYHKENNKLKINNNEIKEKFNKNNNKINEYFKENTNEYNLFKNIESNIFLYCTKTKNAILIIDSFCNNGDKSDDDEGRTYFKNILSKINNAKAPVIILTNNLNILLNKNKKSFKKLDINFIIKEINERKFNIINYYIFVIYLHIKLYNLKFKSHFKKYSCLKNYIENISIDNYELNKENLNLLYKISEYICYLGKFEIEIIDLRLYELFSFIQYKNKEDNFIPNKLEYFLNLINDIIFNESKNIDKNLKSQDNNLNISEICYKCELNSFNDYLDFKRENLIEKEFSNKIILNDSFEINNVNIKEQNNLEGIILDKYLKEEYLHYKFELDNTFNLNNNINSFINNGLFDNNRIDKIHKQDQLILSNSLSKYITICSVKDYIYTIENITKIKKSKFLNNNILDDFIKAHNIEYNVHKVKNKFFLNNRNIFNYSEIKINEDSIKKKKLFNIFD